MRSLGILIFWSPDDDKRSNRANKWKKPNEEKPTSKMNAAAVLYNSHGRPQSRNKKYE